MQNYDDMCQMNNLTQQAILDNLTQRYKQDQIYTSIGPTLISVNPYKMIEKLYESDLIRKMKDNILRGNSLKQPHIYAVAGRAFQGMINKIPKQAIIISGQSGAGKTQSTKHCMQMLTSLSQIQTQQHPISNKILACNPILEAFGNSKTVRNQNSSRFGKYVQIYFGPDHTIKGANIKSYLLEKSRVTNIAQKQRSFHIFYALCASKTLGVKDASAYDFLKQSQCYTASGINDEELFQKVKMAMNQLGFSSEEQQKIWKLLIAILELGNIQFDDSDRQKSQNSPCKIKYQNKIIPILAQTLNLSIEQLRNMLLYSKIQIPKQECILKPMDRSDCKANLHTLCKAIYNSLFQWILTKLQNTLNPRFDLQDFYRTYRQSMKIPVQQSPITARFQINILDIFGFQNFKQNSLEQLCINYTNEKLLDLYNRCVFDNELAILKQDGLENQLDNLQAPSNDASVSLLDAIFRTIKDNTRFKHTKDQDIVSELKANRINNGHIKNLQYDKFDENIFIVQHSPCSVSYNVTNFKLKNQDKLTTEIQNLTINLFHNQKGTTSGRTLLEKFTNQINILNTQLQTASNHYVRCIKPNQQKKNEVVSQFILRQIKYMGVFETIQIRKKVFPYRKSYQQMAYIFEPIFNKSKGKAPKIAVDIILAQLKAKNDSYLLGNRRIYMRQSLEQQINKKILEFDKKRIDSANKIKKYYRKIKFRQNFRLFVEDVISRIKTLKKWGNEADKLMFCCFRQIADRAEKVRQKEIQTSQMELRQSLVQIQQLQNSQIEDQIQFLRSSCRLIEATPEKQNNDQELFPESTPKKLELSNVSSPQNHKAAQAKLIQDLKQKNLSLQQELSYHKKKQGQYESNISQKQTTINSKNLLISQLEQTNKNKQQQCKYLKDQLQNKQKQCQQLTNKLRQTERKLKQIQEHHSPQSIKERIQKMNQLRQPQSNAMQNWQSVQAQLKSLQNQHDKKQQQLETVNRQSHSKQKQLQNMIKDLESIVDNHKEKNQSLETKVEELNQKLYKKCIDYQQILKKYHEGQKRQQQHKNYEKMKNIDKNTIQKLKANLSQMEKQNKQFRDRIDHLNSQIHQYRKVVDGLKTNLSQNNRMNFDVNTTESGQIRPITQQQLFNYIHAYKIGKSQNQLSNLKQKLAFILS